MKLILYADGASRGNPGPAAFGVVLTGERGQVVDQFGKRIGLATNNEAEYRGLLAGLEAALARGAMELEIRLDSELLVAQLEGYYRVRAPNLKRLHSEAKKKLKRFARFTIVHLPRSANSRADALANHALDES